MFSVYDDMLQKPFTLAALAPVELESDQFYSYMTPGQRDFYLRAALKIGAREAERYSGQDVNALTRQLGADVSQPTEIVPERDRGWSGPYAEYDAETRQITVHERGVCRVACLIDQRNRASWSGQGVSTPRYEILRAEEILCAEAQDLGSPPLQDLECPKGFLFSADRPSDAVIVVPESYCLLTARSVPASGDLRRVAPLAEGFSPAALLNGIATEDAVMQLARDLLIAHELFHHLEAISLGPIHRTLPPMTVPLLGGLWKTRRYVKRTREIAAHSFAFTLLGMNERFPDTIDYTSTDRG